MDYRHTQTGYTGPILVLLVLLVFGIAVVGLESISRLEIFIAVLLVVIAVVGLFLSRLTVTVDAETVEAAFGRGWPRRAYDIAEITAIRQVRNRWYYGWGIRKVPGGWMYNVWGLDAVELELASDRNFRIGTDEPSELLGVLSLQTKLPPTPSA